MPVTPALRKLKQEDLGNIVRAYVNKQKRPTFLGRKKQTNELSKS
jgi:hypothetical protein